MRFFAFLLPVKAAKQSNKMKLISVLHSFALFFKSRLYYPRRYTPACAKPPVGWSAFSFLCLLYSEVFSWRYSLIVSYTDKCRSQQCFSILQRHFYYWQQHKGILQWPQTYKFPQNYLWAHPACANQHLSRPQRPYSIFNYSIATIFTKSLQNAATL